MFKFSEENEWCLAIQNKEKSLHSAAIFETPLCMQVN